MTFEELNENQETEHDRQVQEERERKKQEKLKNISQEVTFGVQAGKTPKVKRLQHKSKVSLKN